MMERLLTNVRFAGYYRKRKQLSVAIGLIVITSYAHYINMPSRYVSPSVPRQLPIVQTVDTTVKEAEVNISYGKLSTPESRISSTDIHLEIEPSGSGDKKHDLESEYWGCVKEKVKVGITSYAEVTLTQEPLCNRPRLTDNRRRHEGITLFTSMHEKDASLLYIFNNTLHMWAELRPFVRPVLFMSRLYKDGPLVREACKIGWDVYALPLCNQDNYPVLKAMFQVAQKVSIHFTMPE